MRCTLQHSLQKCLRTPLLRAAASRSPKARRVVPSLSVELRPRLGQQFGETADLPEWARSHPFLREAHDVDLACGETARSGVRGRDYEAATTSSRSKRRRERAT